MSLFAGTEFYIPPKCDRCGAVQAECSCTGAELAQFRSEQAKTAALKRPQEQRAVIRREKRRGKSVTVVTGLTASGNDLPSLLKQLQSVTGGGGTVKAKTDTLELQGDHVAVVAAKLRELGYRV